MKEMLLVVVVCVVLMALVESSVVGDANPAALHHHVARGRYWADRCPYLARVNYMWRMRCYAECPIYKKSSQYCSKSMGKRCCKKYLHDKPDCSSGAYGFYPDNLNCQKYYQCYNKKLNHFTCPLGGVWSKNVTAPACLQIYNAIKECGNRLYHPRCYVPRFINITFKIRNSVGRKPVNLQSFSGTVLRQPLYNIMLDMAGSRTDFNFTTTFNPVFWRSISCIDGLCGKWNPDKTYWTIKDNGVTLPVGVSSFIPKDNDVILFEFVKSK